MDTWQGVSLADVGRRIDTVAHHNREGDFHTLVRLIGRSHASDDKGRIGQIEVVIPRLIPYTEHSVISVKSSAMLRDDHYTTMRQV